MNVRFLLPVLLLLSLLSGCANVSPQTRLARTLVAIGATAVVLGGLAAAGCVDSNSNGCSGGPEDADLAGGLPAVAAGAALITAGFLVKPKAPAGRLFQLPTPVPPPVLP